MQMNKVMRNKLMVHKRSVDVLMKLILLIISLLKLLIISLLLIMEFIAGSVVDGRKESCMIYFNEKCVSFRFVSLMFDV